MIMRFRPANISLINRRHYLPRLLLILSLKYNDKNNPTDVQRLTGSLHIRELRRRNDAESTIHAYRRTIEHFAGYFHCPPNQLGLEFIRR